MSVSVTCKNGHRLRAPDSKAGTTGRCPACGVEVTIPKLSAAPTDSSILRILGVGQELRRQLDEYDANAPESSTPEPLDEFAAAKKPPAPQKKVCPQCDWEIDAGYRICPHCRYYFMK